MFYFGKSKSETQLPTYSEIIRDANFGPGELSPPYLDYAQTVPINIPNSTLSELPINSEPNKKLKIFCTYIFVIIICISTIVLFTTICSILGKYILTN